MSSLIHLIPLGLSGVCWILLWRVNRDRGWLRTGDLVLWDGILLIVIFLVWLRWF